MSKCKAKLFKHGTTVVVLAASGKVIEAIVKVAREESGNEDIDWFWAAGRGTIKACGDLEVAKKAICRAAAIAIMVV